MSIEQIKILGAVLELPATQNCQFNPSKTKMGLKGLNWHCGLAGSSTTAPRILIFFNAMGARPTFYLKFIATLSPPKSWHNIPNWCKLFGCSLQLNLWYVKVSLKALFSFFISTQKYNNRSYYIPKKVANGKKSQKNWKILIKSSYSAL